MTAKRDACISMQADLGYGCTTTVMLAGGGGRSATHRSRQLCSCNIRYKACWSDAAPDGPNLFDRISSAVVSASTSSFL